MLETIPLIVFRGPKDDESNVCVCVCFAEKKLQYRCNARLNTAGMRLLGRGGRTSRLSERKIATMGGRVFYLMPSVEITLLNCILCSFLLKTRRNRNHF